MTRHINSYDACFNKVLILTLFFIFPLIGNATIISGNVSSGSGSFVKLTVPFTESTPDNTVGDDTFQNTNLYGFDEGQNIDITIDLNVDILADGIGGSSGSGIVPKDSTVASHYVFFDPALASSQVGTVTFDSQIFGIITSSNNLANSDFLINTGVNYLNPTLRGLEGGDSVSIIGLNTIEVDWTASTPGDYVRVLTDFSPGAIIPIPAAAWLFGSALLGLLSVAAGKRPKLEKFK